jgi:peptidoglycan/LPS O-acetylase OafA/YrhL
VSRPAEVRAVAAPPPAAVALGGVAVLLVVLQSSGGFTVELLGVDVLLAVAGFRVTHALLEAAVADGPGAGRMPLRAWYRGQLGLRIPLLVVALGVVLAVTLAGRREVAAQAGLDALTGEFGAGNWWLLAGRTGMLDAFGFARDWYADRPGAIDPLGLLWLIGLLVQLALVWPLLLAPLRRLLAVRDRRAVLHRMAPVLVLLAYLAWLVAPARSAVGAVPAELALGTHVRAVEFLFGAAAAAAVVGLTGRRVPRWVGVVLAVLGLVALVGAAVVAARFPAGWLRVGVPAGAALGASLLLLGVQLPTDGPLARALGRGFPLELGKAAYPLLVLHLPVFWLIQLGIPDVRPAALVLAGGAAAWLAGLLLQDGLIRRWRKSWRRAVAVPVVVLGVLGVAAAGATLYLTRTDVRPDLAVARDLVPPPDRPVVLVLGGSTGGDLAAALTGAGPYAVRDATRPGCGILPTPVPPPERARMSAGAQLPGPPAAVCADWAQRWRAELLAHHPVAVVLDLGADAAPTRVPATAPTPCDPAFRPYYRSLLATAVGVLAEPDDRVPVLLAGARAGTGEAAGAARCFDALVAEAVATYPTLVPLDFEALVCPGGVCRSVTEYGLPSADGVHLGATERGQLGPWLAAAVTAELAPERAAARSAELAVTCVPDEGVSSAGC